MNFGFSLAKSGLRERKSCLPPPLKFGAAPPNPTYYVTMHAHPLSSKVEP